MAVLIVLSLIAALGFGIWLGMPRRYDQPLEEIDERLGEEGEHQRTTRHFTFLGLMQKKMEKGSRSRRSQSRKPFRMS